MGWETTYPDRLGYPKSSNMNISLVELNHTKSNKGALWGVEKNFWSFKIDAKQSESTVN